MATLLSQYSVAQDTRLLYSFQSGVDATAVVTSTGKTLGDVFLEAFNLDISAGSVGLSVDYRFDAEDPFEYERLANQTVEGSLIEAKFHGFDDVAKYLEVNLGNVTFSDELTAFVAGPNAINSGYYTSVSESLVFGGAISYYPDLDSLVDATVNFPSLETRSSANFVFQSNDSSLPDSYVIVVEAPETLSIGGPVSFSDGEIRLLTYGVVLIGDSLISGTELISDLASLSQANIAGSSTAIFEITDTATGGKIYLSMVGNISNATFEQVQPLQVPFPQYSYWLFALMVASIAWISRSRVS